MAKKRILFVCIHNSARSQMAEAFVNRLFGDRFEAQSAGLEPGQLNPVVVEAMAEAGLDISKNATKSVFDLWKRGEMYSYVVAVCDAEAAEKCPIFPGVTQKLNWPFPNPAAVAGGREEKLRRAREIRDMIRAQVEAWCHEQIAAGRA